MVKKDYEIRWGTVALTQFKEVFIYIRKDSYQNALRVKKKVVECIERLKSEPRRHTPDKFRIDGNEAFRSFEVYNLRITYFINDSDHVVDIIRVRSVRQEPLSY